MTGSVIVCPVALSARGHSVLAQAVALARAHYAELHLLHVPRELDTGRSHPTGEEDVHPVVNDLIKSRLDHVLGRGRHVRSRITAERGRPERAIAAYARRKHARLIVISGEYRARSGSSGHALARTLGRSAACPVLVVPRTTHRSMAPARASFREIVCAVDFTKVSVSALQVALVFTPSGGRITLVHALGEVSAGLIFSGGEAARLTREYEDQVATVSQHLLRMVPANVSRRCRVDRAVVSGLPHRRILDVASETEAGLIVMGLPRRGRLDEFLRGSISRAVLRGAKIPVLLVPAGMTGRT